MAAAAVSAHASSSAWDPVRLRDGREVELHAMAVSDAAALMHFHRGLSSETVYYRFFNVHPELSEGEVDHFTHVDHRDREAIVATADGEIVGVARFDRHDEGGDAEAAFVIADAWQGQGLGTELFRRLAARAREVGIVRFVAEVMPNNRRMLNVFLHAGLPATTGLRDGVVHVAVDLGEPADQR